MAVRMSVIHVVVAQMKTQDPDCEVIEENKRKTNIDPIVKRTKVPSKTLIFKLDQLKR